MLRKQDIIKFRRIIFALLSVIWMIFIFVMSSRNADMSTLDSQTVGRIIANRIYADFESLSEARQLEIVEGIDFVVRKSAHATEYAILSALLLGATVGDALTELKRREILIAWIVTSVYAVTDEIHQLFVEGRSGQVTDVLIDSASAVFFLLIVTGILKLFRYMLYKSKTSQDIKPHCQ